jgi:hypothetical protein
MFIGLAALPRAGSAVDLAGYHKFGVNGKAVLCVPSSDMNPVLMPYNDESTRLTVGSGHTPGFAFSFRADQVQSQIDVGSFRVFPELDKLPNVNSLGGSVGFLSVPDSLRLGPAMRARDLSDEWFANGHCAEAVVSRIQPYDLFELKCTAKDNYSNILNREPDPGKALPDPNTMVVATCLYETISAGKFAGHALRNCRRVVILEEFIVDYQIQKDNVPLYRQIDQFLRRKIVEWKGNCSEEPSTKLNESNTRIQVEASRAWKRP